MELIDKITELLDEIKMDGNKFYQKGNKSAGVRARKHAQDLKKILQDLFLICIFINFFVSLKSKFINNFFVIKKIFKGGSCKKYLLAIKFSHSLLKNTV